jgi:hypothetical protein
LERERFVQKAEEANGNAAGGGMRAVLDERGRLREG